MEFHKRKKSEFDVRLSETRSLLKEMMEEYESTRKKDPDPNGQVYLPYDIVVDNDTMWFMNDPVKMKVVRVSDGSIKIELDRSGEVITLAFDTEKEAEDLGWVLD
jgi:HSP20 family molecular chaperone IbpA